MKCLAHYTNTSSPIFDSIYTRTNSSFESRLRAYTRFRKFLAPGTPKPLAIIAAQHETHVQATVICAKSNGLQIRIRSGGHDFEGLSYISEVPFVLLDMFNLRAINIDTNYFSGWVQAGATLGELYHTIATKVSKTHAFPSGVCPTVGAGGHFSGGGYGNLMRKYGLAIDNIANARIVDANGNILDRKSMGEDLFWAIRGGGGASFGVVLEWYIHLVPVPENVTVFRVRRDIEQGVTDIAFRWQQVAPDLDKDLYIRVMPVLVNSNKLGERNVVVSFIGMFLGQTDRLLGLMNESFPELGLVRQDCKEMSWIESTLFWAEFPSGSSIDRMIERPEGSNVSGSFKSDFVKDVIPKSIIESMWMWMKEYEVDWMEWNPLGGRMSEISETETPFPHRGGNLFLMEYASQWKEEGVVHERVELLRKMYELLTPYVSRNPREAFLNYRDIDIGSNPSNVTDFKNGEIYGRKYHKNNFVRLARIKGRVDPDNFFKHQQSIPPLYS
ncbi:FAD-binding Berberine family protein [Euphorbia peplus]|nr:FAD-binding Berberine family protein [Euphorbia peplus]